MLRVRRAKKEDATAISHCTRLAYADECDKRNVKNLEPEYPSVNGILIDIEKHIYYTVLMDDSIIGGLYLVRKNDRLIVEDFCIHPEHQNKGFGYKVMMIMESLHPKTEHWRLVTPTYSVGNQALYHKLGYNRLGTVIEDGLEVIQYEKHLCVMDDSISLEFARISDRKKIYDMLVSPEVHDHMFDAHHLAPTYEEFCEEADTLYGGQPNKEGNYLVIKHEGLIIGSISYSLNEGVHKSYELDIWIEKKDYLGKGIGTQSIKMLMGYIQKKYDIHTFLIRPWNKNQNAIKAYLKCGFTEINQDALADYYSEEDYALYGAGDYGEETINLVANKN